MKMGKSSKMWNGVWFAVAACSLMIPSQLEAGNSVNEVIAIDQAKIGVKVPLKRCSIFMSRMPR